MTRDFFGVVHRTLTSKAKKRRLKNNTTEVRIRYIMFIKVSYGTMVILIKLGLPVSKAVRLMKKYVTPGKSLESIRAKINRLRGVKK